MDPRSDARRRKLIAIWTGTGLTLLGSMAAEIALVGDHLWWALGGTAVVGIAIAVAMTRRSDSTTKAEPKVTVWELRDHQKRQLRRRSKEKGGHKSRVAP